MFTYVATLKIFCSQKICKSMIIVLLPLLTIFFSIVFLSMFVCDGQTIGICTPLPISSTISNTCCTQFLLIVSKMHRVYYYKVIYW